MASVCNLIAQPPLRNAFPPLVDRSVQGAFLLGAISPDVRALSGHTREETHFFTIPPAEQGPAYATMLKTHPRLANLSKLGEAHTAFVAGYITHLTMDETWLEVVVMPGLYIAGERWGTKHPNWFAYSLLMTWLEYRAAERMPAEAVGQLAGTEPQNWLPFVRDRHLRRWRDRVVKLIQKGGARHISRMFAHTNNISPAKLEAIVQDDTRMHEEVFSVVPRDTLHAFELEADRRSEAAVLSYLTTTSI